MWWSYIIHQNQNNTIFYHTVCLSFRLILILILMLTLIHIYTLTLFNARYKLLLKFRKCMKMNFNSKSFFWFCRVVSKSSSSRRSSNVGADGTSSSRRSSNSISGSVGIMLKSLHNNSSVHHCYLLFIHSFIHPFYFIWEIAREHERPRVAERPIYNFWLYCFGKYFHLFS